MLREISWVNQIKGEPRRRWFSDPDLDLIVWEDDGDVVGFQLCYGKLHDEQAVSWQSPDSYSHSRVDSGECRPGRHKAAAVLVPGGRFDALQVARDFLTRSLSIEPSISSFVYRKLLEYARINDFSVAS